MQPTFPLIELSRAEKIACLKRELVIRLRVYPKEMIAGRMKPRDAQYEIDCINAILADYHGGGPVDLAEGIDAAEVMRHVSHRLPVGDDV